MDDLPYDYCIIGVRDRQQAAGTMTSLEHELQNIRDLYIKRVKKWENIKDTSDMDKHLLRTYSFNYLKIECDSNKIIDNQIITKRIWKLLYTAICSYTSKDLTFDIYLLSVGRGIMKNYAMSTGMKVYDHIHNFTTLYDDRLR